MVVVGLLVERFLIRRMYGRELPEQLLLTFALVLILGDVIKLIWGVQNRRIFVPVHARWRRSGSSSIPYHFFLIGVGRGGGGRPVGACCTGRGTARSCAPPSSAARW